MNNFPLADVTLTSSTDTTEAMNAALSDSRYGLEIVPESAAPATASPTTETPAPAGTVPADGKTEVAPEATPPQGKEGDPPVAEAPDDENETEESTAASVREALPRGVQRKLDRLVRSRGKEREARAAAEARATELEKQLVEAKGKPAVAPEKPAEVKPADPVAAAAPPKPKEEDFPDDYSAFVEALADWKSEQRVTAALTESNKKIADLEERLEKSRTQEKQAEVADQIWAEKIEQARAVEPDLDEVMARPEVKAMELSYAMIREIQDADGANGPRLMLYLAKHPEDAKRIFESSNLPEKPTPAQVEKAIRVVSREFAKIEDRLTTPPVLAVAPPAEPPASAPQAEPAAAAPPAQQRPPARQAPAPISPVGTRSATPTVDPSAMSTSEYLKYRASNPGR